MDLHAIEQKSDFTFFARSVKQRHMVSYRPANTHKLSEKFDAKFFTPNPEQKKLLRSLTSLKRLQNGQAESLTSTFKGIIPEQRKALAQKAGD